MPTPTLVVAANGYTRDHVAVALYGGLRIVNGRIAPLLSVVEHAFDKGQVRFVTDNDLDDGVFQVQSVE